MLKSLPPSDCARAREAASARLDGELSELEEAHLLRHLRFCAECRAHTREVAELAHRLRSAPLEMPTETLFVDRPSSRLRARSATVAVALVLAAALSFGTGGLVGSQGSSSGGAVTSTLEVRNDSIDQLVLAMLRGHQTPDVRPVLGVTAIS
jgi:predicted anti-sigma-YlaC factor YlaD